MAGQGSCRDPEPVELAALDAPGMPGKDSACRLAADNYRYIGLVWMSR